MTPRPQPSPLLGLVLLAAIGISAASYHSLLRAGPWWIVTVGAAALVLAAMAVARRLARRAWIPLVAGFGTGVLGLTLAFVPGSAILGVVPTLDTIGAVGDLVADGLESIATQGIPANATPGIMFLLAAGFSAIALLLDALTFAARRPALTGIPLLLLIAVPSLIDTTVREPVFFVLAAVAYFVLVLSRTAVSQRRLAVGVSAGAIVGALILSLVLPPVLSNENVNLRANGYTTGLNPFINLGEDLRRGAPVTAIEYTTDSIEPLYFTMTVLKDFDGEEWSPVEREGGVADVDGVGSAPGRAPDATTLEVTTEASIGNIAGRWLPLPYSPTSIDGLVGNWEWNPESLVFWTTDSNMRNQEFTVTSELATPSAQELYATGTATPDGLEDYLALPDELDPVVADTAREVVGDASTNYEMAIALQSYFRGGEFVYSTEAPVEQGYDGSSAEVIARFLELKSGYCVHFASAFATMARTLEIPARIGVGFTSGARSLDLETRTTTYTVTTDELHAWPELYFDEIGWVRFEPTVSRGSVPSFGTLQNDDPETEENEATQTPTATPTPTGSTDAPTRAPEGQPEQNDPAAVASPALRTAVTWIAVGIGALTLLLLPAIWRAGRRARRFRRVTATGSPFEAWNEVRDYAVDLGLPASASETPRAFATDLSTRIRPAAADALSRLLEGVEAEAFAPDDARRKVGAADLRTVLVAMRAGAARVDRLRARFIPASVLGRRRRATEESSD